MTAWIDPRPWPGPLRLTAAQSTQLRRWIADGYPHETCGLLVGRHTDDEAASLDIVRVVQAANLNRTRARDRYELDPDAYLRVETAAEAEGHDVVGIWHSHPDVAPVPSITDHERAWDGLAYLIVRVATDGAHEARSWRRAGDRFREQPIVTTTSPEEAPR